MAFGELHSSGTLCTARLKCPLESEGGHFDSLQALVDHTAKETGVAKEELNSVLDTGVTPREVVAMAREGILDGTVPVSERQAAAAPKELKHPAKLTIDLDAGRGTPDIEKSFMEEMEAQGFPVAELEDFGDGRFAFTVEAAGDPEAYSVVMAGSTAALNAHRRAGMPEEDLEEYGEWMDIHAEMGRAVSDGEDS